MDSRLENIYAKLKSITLSSEERNLYESELKRIKDEIDTKEAWKREMERIEERAKQVSAAEESLVLTFTSLAIKLYNGKSYRSTLEELNCPESLLNEVLRKLEEN